MLKPQLVGRPDPDNVYALDHGALPLIAWMQRTGMLVDTKALQDLGADIRIKLEHLSRDIYKLAGKEFNISSDEQLAELLFSKRSVGGLGIDPKYIKRTKKTKRPSVRADELQKVIGEHPVIKPVIEHKHLDHLIDSFIEPLPRWIGEDGRLRTNILTTRVKSGRYSMKDPNMMNIPTRTKIGKRIRGCFIARKGCKLLSVDLSQIEMRVAAHLANCLKMIQCFLDGDDIHWRTAENVMHMPRPKDPAALEGKAEPQPGELSKAQRDSFKNVGFGVLYLVQAQGLRNQIITKGGDPEYWTIGRCDELIEFWFGEYGEIRERQEIQFYRARRYGYVWDMWGRIRHIPEVRSLKPHIIGEGLRAAGNHETQASAVGLSKVAMHRDNLYAMCEVYTEMGKVCDPLLQYHDEVLMEVSEDIIDEVGYFTKKYHCEAVELRVPIEAGMSIGSTWADLK
jgi:DNA polymerase-1